MPLSEQDVQDMGEWLAHIAPHLGEIFESAMLRALRQHSEEQAVQIGAYAATYHRRAEAPGEREVWAQAYCTTFGQWWDKKDTETAHTNSCTLADNAVKAFRERYK